jgi:hypothetical protein
MKTKRILLVIALFAACNVMAQQQTGQHTVIYSTTATMPDRNVNFHWLVPTKPSDSRNDREPVEGLSPQPWTATVGWHPGETAFPNSENFSTRMPLIWFGHEPWQ